MESWVPLFDIFLNSPLPESEASRWLRQYFNPSSSSSSSSTTISTSSFLSLLTKPTDAIVVDSSIPTTSSPPENKRVMWIQTLPNAVQSRILSFLTTERGRFCARDLCRLARNVLKDDQGIDFWVKKAALNLFDVVSDSGYEWISGLNLDSAEEGGDVEEFESVPSWLKNAATGSNNLVLPWLPVSPDELNLGTLFGNCEDASDSMVDIGEDDDENLGEVAMDVKSVSSTIALLDPEIQNMAASLKARILNFESSSKTIALVSEIRQLCLEKGGDSFAVLGLIEPWRADDETASVLISHLSDGSEEELGWPSQVLCSIILPKFLHLEQPASRVLLTATVEYCKLRQKAAVYALLFPLILLTEGINNLICDVITRVMKECLHPAHVSAFCHKLLCEEEEDVRRFICLPCHKHLISSTLVWTESLFTLFQNILNHNIHITQDSVDYLVYQVHELAERFSKSLKFGNFLLCFVTKCSMLLKSHKLSLTEAVGRTNTLVTKSVLAKLSNL